MGLALEVPVTLTEISCGICGGTYAINERYRKHKQENSGFWNCPYCRCLWGFAKGDNQRLREELEAEKKRTQAALARENELRSANLTMERKLKRVQRGVCPQCNRTFQDLARHMAHKHKD